MKKAYLTIIIIFILSALITFIACPAPTDGGDSGDAGDAGDAGDGGTTTTYDLTVDVMESNTTNATISYDPDTYPTFNENEVVTMTPSVDAGGDFAFWQNYETYDHVGDVTDNGDGSYEITMDEDKFLSARFADIASLGVSQTGPIALEGTLLFKYNVTIGNNYQISYSDSGTTDAYVNLVYKTDGTYYGNVNDYFIEGPGTKTITPTEDVMFIEVIDWGSNYSTGGDINLVVTDITTK